MDVALTLAVKTLLRERLTAARDEYSRASQQFGQVIGDVPSGIPSPDGVLCLKQARVDLSTALAQYLKALSALDNFEVKGVLPNRPGPTITPRADCEECVRLWREVGWATERIAHLRDGNMRLSPEDTWAVQLSIAKTTEAEKALAAARLAIEAHRYVADH